MQDKQFYFVELSAIGFEISDIETFNLRLNGLNSTNSIGKYTAIQIVICNLDILPKKEQDNHDKRDDYLFLLAI